MNGKLNRFLLCVNNKAYPASLELQKVYKAIPDDDAATRKFVRIVDESGTDYLYPESLFVQIPLPPSGAKYFPTRYVKVANLNALSAKKGKNGKKTATAKSRS
jgi:hypothetical protein